MTKKRQQDFAKVQLKPGRFLSKRRNITASSFKAKKIIMPKEKITKMKPENTIQDSIRRIVSCGNEKNKVLLLNELNKMIRHQSDTLNDHLSNIFGAILDYVRDPYDGIRNAALKVITSVLNITDDSQLYNYADLLSNTISAIMKNPSSKIASTALILLDCMLKNHPDLICHNIDIVHDLVPIVKKHYTRKINTEKERYQYSERDDINALGHINAFLKEMLKDRSDMKSEEDDKIVYMNSDDSLYLEIYAGGGLQPIDIEEAYSKQFAYQISTSDELDKLTPLVNTLLKIIPTYFRQVLASASNADDNTFRCEPIADLSILMQLLCNVAELAEKISLPRVDEEIASFLKESIFFVHRRRFPFELHTTIPGTSPLPLALLNASVCYLFMKFLSLGDSFESDEKIMEKYVDRFFCLEKTYISQIKCECIPYFVKTIKLFHYMPNVPKVIYLILKRLVLLLKTRVNHPNKKMLIDFLFNMSVLPGYTFWIDSIAMKLWYEWLLSHFRENLNKLDKKIIKMILKIAKVKHSSFLECLDFSLIKSLLKSRYDDRREAAIFLLHSMDIDGELLKNVYDIISLDSFPKDCIVKVIHMLHARFVQYPVNEECYVDYIEFLFNVAVDTYNISNSRMISFESNKYAKILEPLHGTHTFNIIPSLYWKHHSKVFDVCLKYLRSLSNEAVLIIQLRLLKELLQSTSTLPMHCVLAILKLDNANLKHDYHRLLMRDLKFSCLITVSVLMQMEMEDEWFKWNAAELNNSLSLTTKTALDILDVLQDQGHFGKPTVLVVYHTLRVIKVLVEKGYLDCNNTAVLEMIIDIMMNFKNMCYDKSIVKQPLFQQLYDYFTTHYCD